MMQYKLQVRNFIFVVLSLALLVPCLERGR